MKPLLHFFEQFMIELESGISTAAALCDDAALLFILFISVAKQFEPPFNCDFFGKNSNVKST